MSQTESPRADPELERFRSLRDAMIWVAGMMLLTYLASLLTLPVKALTLLFAVAGLVWGVIALMRSVRIPAPWLARVAVAGAMAGCVFFAFVASVQMLFWGPTAEFESCIGSALTDRALHACTTDYAEHMGQMAGTVPGSAPASGSGG